MSKGRVIIKTDVPDEDVDQLVEDFESEGAKVEKTRQPDGKWIVKALFPDEK